MELVEGVGAEGLPGLKVLNAGTFMPRLPLVTRGNAPGKVAARHSRPSFVSVGGLHAAQGAKRWWPRLAYG